jgi:hypothetical protein
MSDTLLFALGVLVVVLVWGGISLRKVNLKEYFGTKTGKGILKGILLAVAFSLVFVLFSSKSEAKGWFNYAEVFAGLDYTKNTNPMCVAGEVDERSGSNIGLTFNIYEQNRFTLNSKYTHHSCAFGEDNRSYDGIGIELKYRFWSK